MIAQVGGMRRRTVGAIVLATVVAAAAPAAELDTVVARGELVWAADQEGGGPHVFPDPADPRRLTGFEVDLAALLAEAGLADATVRSARPTLEDAFIHLIEREDERIQAMGGRAR